MMTAFVACGNAPDPVSIERDPRSILSLLNKHVSIPYVDPDLTGLNGSVRVVIVVKDDANISCIAEHMISCRVTPSFGGVKVVLGAITAGNVGALASNTATLAVLRDRELQFVSSMLPRDLPEDFSVILGSKAEVKPDVGEVVELKPRTARNVTMRDVVRVTNATGVWADYNVTGEGVTLAVVDTGVDYGSLGLGYWDVMARDVLGYPAAFDADAMCLVYTNITLTTFANASGTFIPTSGLDPLVYFPLLIQYGYLPAIPFSYLFGEPFPSDMDVTGMVESGKGCHWGVMFQWLFGLDLFPTIVVDLNEDGVYETVYVDMSFDWCWMPYWYNKTIGVTWPFWSAPWPPDFSFTDEAELNVTSPVGARDFTGDSIYDLSVSSLGYFLDVWGMSPNFVDRGLVLQPIDPHGNYACFVYDFYGHGTSCASCAAGRELGHPLFGNGIAYNSRIMGITALFIGDIIEGELWAAGFDLIPGTEGWTPVPGYGTLYGVWEYTGNHKADIISNSWGWSEWALGHLMSATPWYDVLTAMEDALTISGYLDPYYPGTVVVHAVGNGGPGYGSVTEPGYSTLVISVGASTSMNWTKYAFGFAGGYYDDVISWSARGPTALGVVKPDIVGIGAYGFAPTAVFQGLGDGASAFWIFGGTSMATPVVAGAAALVEQGFKESYGLSPMSDVVKLILKSTAVDLGYDSFVQGAGRVDCYRAVSLAMNNHGIAVGSTATWDNVYNMTLVQWTTNNYLFQTQLPPWAPSPPIYDTSWFAGAVRPGESSAAEFTVWNPSAESVSINILPFVHRQIGQTTTIDGLTEPMPEDWHTYDWNWGNITILDKAMIPDEAELMTVSLVVPYEYFDPDRNYTWNQRWGLMIQDWNDTNDDGVVNVDEVWQVNYGYNTGTSNEVTVGFPTFKFKHNPILFVYQRNATGVPLTTVPFKIFIRFYDRVPWDLVTLSSTTFTIPSGSFESFNATLNVPSDAYQGVYEGQIIVNVTEPYSRMTVIPVSVCVPATMPLGELVYNIAQPEATGLYDPYRVEGYFDWNWRYEAGDWRSWLFEFTDPSTVAAFVSADWAGTMTDIDMFSIHPFGIIFDGTGEYWIEDGKFLWSTRTNLTEEYVILYTAPIPESPPLPNLHTVLLHNVLFDGAAFPENVSCSVKVVNVEPTLPAEVTITAGESKSWMFNLTTGMRLTNVSLSTISPFPIHNDPNSTAEIPAGGSWSFEAMVSVPSGTQPGTYWAYALLGAAELPPGYSIPLLISINVPAVEIVDVTLDVGRVHFPGELAQLYILTAYNGTPFNVTNFARLTLWYRAVNGTFYSVKLNENVQPIDLGLFGVPFKVPAEATSCVLVVGVEMYVEETNTIYKGVSMVSFDVTSTLSNWNAWLETIVGDTAILKTDVGTVKVNLASLNATLVNLIVDSKGEVIAKVETMLGIIETSLDKINATLVSLNETEVGISTALGLVKTDINTINLKVEPIHGDLVAIKTDLGTINGTVVRIEGDVYTIETKIGTVIARVEGAPQAFYGIWAALAFSFISLIAGVCAIFLLTRKRKPVTSSDTNK
jgi:subtilisin family serine protease